MYSDQRNFKRAREIKWSSIGLAESFFELYTTVPRTRFVFVTDSASTIDFSMIDPTETFKFERIVSLLRHDWIPLGFLVPNQFDKEPDVLYLHDYDRVGLTDWVGSLLEQFGNVGTAVIQSARADQFEDRVRRVEMNDRERDWIEFARKIYALVDMREEAKSATA